VLIELIAELGTGVISTMKAIILKRSTVFRVVIPYLPTFLGFLVFLRWNGGIVLGRLFNSSIIVD